MICIYGIPNCNTVKKARQWLAERHIDAPFVDFKKNPPTATMLQHWLTQVPAATLINRKGTTWRQLSPAQQAQASDDDGAVALMMAQPSLIKRPVLAYRDAITVGFAAADYAALFAQEGTL